MKKGQKRKKHPFVSVVIPTYNSRDSLVLALTYLLKQTYPHEHYEVVVVDDGSTDGTRDAIKELKLPPSFKYFCQERKRQGAARNLGISKSRGQYILFLDSDIIPSFNLIESHVRLHGKYPDSAIQGEVVPSAGTSIIDAINMNEAFSDRSFEDEEDIGYEAVTCNLSVKRKHLLSVGGFNESFDCYGSEDTDLGFRLVTKTGLELRYSKEAKGYSYKSISFEERAQKQWENGKSAVRLFRLHPEIFHPEFLNSSGKRFLSMFNQAVQFKPLSYREIQERKSDLLKLEKQYQANPLEAHKALLVKTYKRFFSYAIGEGMFCEINDLEKKGSIFSASDPKPETHLVGIPVRWLEYEDYVTTPYGLQELLLALKAKGFLLEAQQALEKGQAGAQEKSSGNGLMPKTTIAIHHCPSTKKLNPEITDYNIFYWDCELDEKAENALARFGRVADEIWVPSTFAKARLEKNEKQVQVLVMPAPVSWADLYSLSEAKPFEIKPARFVYATVLRTRNLPGLAPFVAAYLQEFKPDEPVAFLIIITDHEPAGRDLFEQQISRLTKNLQNQDQPTVIILSGIKNWPAFLRASDCYVYPASGEDFHLPALASVLMETPLVASNAGGHSDFIDAKNSYLFNGYSNGKASTNGKPATSQKALAYVAGIRECLRRAFEKSEALKSDLRQMKTRVAERHDPAKVASTIEKRLHQVYVEHLLLRMKVFHPAGQFCHLPEKAE